MPILLYGIECLFLPLSDIKSLEWTLLLAVFWWS